MGELQNDVENALCEIISTTTAQHILHTLCSVEDPSVFGGSGMGKMSESHKKCALQLGEVVLLCIGDRMKLEPKALDCGL